MPVFSEEDIMLVQSAYSFELLSLSKEYGQEFDAASPYFRRMAARLDSIHEHSTVSTWVLYGSL
jgi:hypothetical protein